MAKKTKNESAEGAKPAEQRPAQKQADYQKPAPPSGIIAEAAPPRELIPVGNHFARCYEMIYMGNIWEEFQGAKIQNKKVRISWELPTELRAFKPGDPEKPMAISQEFTLSISKRANLRKMIDSWRGVPLNETEAAGFDITKLLGKACLLNIIHKPTLKDPNKINELIASIAPPIKGMPTYEPINEIRYFNFGDKFDQAFVEKLPDYLKTKIKSSDEWKEKMGTAAGGITTDLSIEGAQTAEPLF